MGEKNKRLPEMIDKFRETVPHVAIGSLDVESCRSFLDYYRQSTNFDLPVGHDLVFAKQAKSIRTRRPKNRSKSKNFVNGTPIHLASELDIFYLTAAQYEAAFLLPAELIWLEEFTWYIEFARKYGPCDAYRLKAALTSPGIDDTNNYQVLECIGDVLIKFYTVLSLYWNANER
jgi:hypothetical protein